MPITKEEYKLCVSIFLAPPVDCKLLQRDPALSFLVYTKLNAISWNLIIFSYSLSSGARRRSENNHITYLGVPTHSTLLNPRVESRSTKN